MIQKYLKTSYAKTVAGVFLLLATLYLFNLNYNSAFNDEAIYVVIGQYGIFRNDWYTLYAISWMMGHPFFYPVVAALSYAVGGIVLMRALNVLFLLGTLWFVYKIVKRIDIKTGNLSALLTIIILGFSSVSYMVGRLATYDMPGFFFLSVALYYFAKAYLQPQNKPRNYLFSGFYFFVGFLFKYVVAFYAPVAFIFFLVVFAQKDKRYKDMLIYFLVPLGIAFIAFIGIYWEPIQILLADQVEGIARYSYTQVLSTFASTSNVSLFYLLLGSLLMWYLKQRKLLVALLVFGATPLLYHLHSQRILTLEKHTFMSVAAMATLAGIGFCRAIHKWKVLQWPIFALIFVFSIFSVTYAQHYNSLWLDTRAAEEMIADIVSPHDVILTELGDSTTLAVVDIVPVDNVVTFDYLEYEGFEGDKAYENALGDNYFDYILLATGEREPLYLDNGPIRAYAREVAQRDYSPVYRNADIIIYERRSQ